MYRATDYEWHDLLKGRKIKMKRFPGDNGVRKTEYLLAFGK